MKNFYSTVLIVLISFLINAGKGQDACPGPNPPAVRNISYIVNDQQVCVVFVENMIPDAPVTLFGAGLITIPSASGNPVVTDGSGFASFVYSCNQNPTRIVTCNVQGCCASLVPPAAFLPVKLSKFIVRLKDDNTASLDWTSVVEVNSSKYVVERSSDGRNFQAVGIVAAAGNSSHSISYNYVDKLPGNGAYYYRLRQVDLDAKSEHSRVVYLNSNKGYGLITKIFPNPFQSEIQIIGITSADLNKKNLRVFNAAGQQVNYRIAGANAIMLDEAAPKGMYVLQVKDQRFKLIRN